MAADKTERPRFYYDVGSPPCWLAAEGIGGHAVWEPVLASALGAVAGDDLETLAHRAREAGLPAPRWPEALPFDSTLAMRAATFAKQTGRAVAFSLAAMRQAFLAGRDLSLEDNVLIAAAACELHPRAVLTAVGTRAVTDALMAATEGARALGVWRLPALAVGGALHSGLDELERHIPRTP